MIQLVIPITLTVRPVLLAVKIFNCRWMAPSIVPRFSLLSNAQQFIELFRRMVWQRLRQHDE